MKTMSVRLIAHTVLTGACLDILSFDASTTTDADHLGEFAGRACYQSFDRPNPATAANWDYLANIEKQQHYSVLEHASVSLYVEHVSRALLAELTRHRHLSFSVLSQRYVDMFETEPVIPPAMEGDPMAVRSLQAHYADAVEVYSGTVDRLRRAGLPVKQAREAARAHLPNAAPVNMVVSGNLRAWRDVLGKRHHVAADAEIQRFAREVLVILRQVAPASVQDITSAPVGA